MYSIEQHDDQLTGTTARIRYHLSFPNAGSHIIDVGMEVDRPDNEVSLVLPAWIPGSYKVRDFVSFQGDVRAFDEDGNPLEIKWLSSNRLSINCTGVQTLRLRHTYYANERTVRMSHVTLQHAFVNPANCLMYVEGRSDEIHHVAIESPWSTVSTALSPVRPGTWGALNYDVLVDSPIEIGDHFVAEYERHGARHEVAITGDGDYDSQWIVAQTKKIVDRTVEMWGDVPYDRYVFIVQLLPGKYGGLEHARSSVNMFDGFALGESDRVLKFLTLLCHEYFHLWNVKRIRPIELGPFDYTTPNYTQMLWLAEGATSYYDDLMAYRCGFSDRDDFLRALASDHLSALANVPGRHAMSIRESSQLSWVKLYVPTPDSHNRFPSYYTKGAVVFLLLDLHIIAETQGEKRMDHVMRALWQRYVEQPARGITDDEFHAIVFAVTGVNVQSDWQQPLVIRSNSHSSNGRSSTPLPQHPMS